MQIVERFASTHESRYRSYEEDDEDVLVLPSTRVL